MRAIASPSRSRSPPGPNITTQMLKDSERRLLEMVRRVGYGSLGNISVRHGEVILGFKVHTRRRHRLAKPDSGRCSRLMAGPFKLKRQHLEMIHRIRSVTDGVVTIEVQDGLPTDVIVEEDVDV